MGLDNVQSLRYQDGGGAGQSNMELLPLSAYILFYGTLMDFFFKACYPLFTLETEKTEESDFFRL